MFSSVLTQRFGQPHSLLTRFINSRWSPACLTAAISLLGLTSTATASEQITLKYGTDERTFLVENVANFTQTGEATDPELRAFFDRHTEAKRILQTVFGAEVYISPGFVSRLRERAGSPTVEFVLIQLNKFVNTSAVGEVRNDLQPLRTALVESLEDDNRFSLTELISRYPKSEIQLDLTGLEPVYNDVKGFMERVLPALEVARDYLQNVICDCETAPTAQTSPASRASSSTEAAAVATAQPADCIDVPVGQTGLSSGQSSGLDSRLTSRQSLDGASSLESPSSLPETAVTAIPAPATSATDSARQSASPSPLSQP